MRIPPCENYGDVDGDGYVTSEDAVAAGRHYYGTDLFPDGQLSGQALNQADVDGDGAVTIKDAGLMLDYAAGRAGTFPVCERLGLRAGRGAAVIALGLIIIYILSR